MQFCVLGLGRFGRNLALSLAGKGHEVLAADIDESRVREVDPYVDRALVMDITDEEAIRSLGLEHFDYVIVALSGNTLASILATSLVKEHGARRVIAKAASDLHAKILRRVGADRVIFPEREMGERLAQSLSSPGVFDFLELSEEYSIVELVAPKPLVGKTLRESRVRSAYGVYVIGIRRKQPELTPSGDIDYREVFILAPSPDEEIKEGDVLVILGRNTDIERVRKL